MAKRKQTSDFRYATEAAKIAWDAVGEKVGPDDVGSLVEFLLPEPTKGGAAYRRRLKAARRAIGELGEVSSRVGKLSLGDQVQAVERQAAKFLGAKYACFLTNATAGFEIAYKLAGLRPGDEVIAPSITFVATIAYPLSIGALRRFRTSGRCTSFR